MLIMHSQKMRFVCYELKYCNGLNNSNCNSLRTVIPAAILQDRFFSTSGPNYVNYASIGTLVGHEITHGFDDQGRQYDFIGNLVDCWNPETGQQFLEKAKCIIEQYSNYMDLNTNLTVTFNQFLRLNNDFDFMFRSVQLNGVATQGENIADNGGVKEAYYAYENWVKRNGPEKRLPNLKYSQQQLFFISYAQMWCSNSRNYIIKNQIITDDHAPMEFRINGAISNMPETTFAKISIA